MAFYFQKNIKTTAKKPPARAHWLLRSLVRYRYTLLAHIYERPRNIIELIQGKEAKIISFQVIRVQGFSKGSLIKIGGETERTSENHRNQDIDNERTPLNYYYKKSNGGLYTEWKSTMANFNATFKNKKGANAFEGIIVTSDSGFFERLGYVKGEPMPPKVRLFFDAAYSFVLKEIGYNGTDLNVLSAAIHLDETTPHLQLYYIPIVDVGKKKIYAKDENGKVIRNENGSPVQAKGADGKSLYEYIKLPQPKVCSSDFWEQRGGKNSFGNLQDDFYDCVSRRFGLERGEKGSNRKHTTKYQWEKSEQEKEIKKLEERKLRLSTELEPLEEMITTFKEALNGEKPSSKKKLQLQVSGLIYKYNELERQHKITVKDNETLFNELYGLKQNYPQLEEYAELMKFLERNAPDKLAEAKDVAIARQRNRFEQKNKNNSFYK